MRFFYSGAEFPFHIEVEKVLARSDFMISFASLPNSGECERLESCDPSARTINPGSGFISEEGGKNG